MKNNIRARGIIKTMVQKIKREYHPDKVILFGSYAWGKPDRHSDIDLFIVKKTKDRHIDRSVEVAKILDEENGIFALDLLVYNPKEVSERLRIGDPFIKNIIERGVVLYG